jgi:ABC-type sugar transport system ATPase subunit
MRLEIAKLHKRLGTTMIYVTHDQMEAMTLADRIVVMRDGKIEQIGTPGEIYDKPVNRFVAGFMGAPKMSFLTARVISREGRRLALEVPGATQGNLNIELVEERALPDELVVGVRPEHFGDAFAGPRLLADIEFVERLGGESFLHAPSHPAGPLVMRQNDGSAGQAGKREVAVNWSRAHLFAPDGAAVQAKLTSADR